MAIDFQSFLMGVASGSGGGSVPTGSTTITENGEYDVTEYATANVDVAGGISGGYTVTFKVDGNDYYIASCKQGESITNPPASSDNLFYKWKDVNDNDISFPYTPAADIELYGTVLYNADLLVHCDDFADSGKNQLSLTNNGAEVDTTTKKFGTGSWHFTENTDYVQVNNIDTKFNLEDNDFTIDFWLYPTAFTGAFVGCWTNAVNKAFIITTTSSNGAYAFAWGYGTQMEMFSIAAGQLTLNQWQHIAFTRHEDTIYAFVNGNKISTYAMSSTNRNINSCSGKNLWIGRNSDTAQSNDHTTGYIDELRILNGTCAWTENFTPPTNPY